MDPTVRRNRDKKLTLMITFWQHICELIVNHQISTVLGAINGFAIPTTLRIFHVWTIIHSVQFSEATNAIAGLGIATSVIITSTLIVQYIRLSKVRVQAPYNTLPLGGSHPSRQEKRCIPLVFWLAPFLIQMGSGQISVHWTKCWLKFRNYFQTNDYSLDSSSMP